MIFTPVEDFWCEETQTQYCKGLTYSTARQDFSSLRPKARAAAEKRQEELAKLAPQWLAQGKVVEGGMVTGVRGLGEGG